MAKKTISISVEEKLKALYDLQCVDSEIDQLRIVRGELPVEIQDLEDEIARLEVRLEKFEEEKAILKTEQKAKKEDINAFCLTVDKSGHDYLKTMCQDMAYEVLDDIHMLPERLLYLYTRLTT